MGSHINNYSSTSTPGMATSSNRLIIAWNGTDSAHSLKIGCIVCTGQAFGTGHLYHAWLGTDGYLNIAQRL